MIIDTSVLSAVVSKNAALKLKAAEFLKANSSNLMTCPIVIYEIEYGLLRNNSLKLFESFRALVEKAIIIISIDLEISQIAALKRVEMEKKGITLHTEDLLIGATAKKYDLPIVTQNIKDFEAWGCEIISPL